MRLGYVANWLTGWMAFDRDVLDALGLKPDEKIAGFIHIGKAERPTDDRPRPRAQRDRDALLIYAALRRTIAEFSEQRIDLGRRTRGR